MKFEENIREKLEMREMKPSPLAWERIEKELNHSAKRKNKKGYSWLLIAASFIGILIVAGTLFVRNELSQSQRVVDAPLEEEKLESNVPNESSTPSELNERVVESPSLDQELIEKQIIKKPTATLEQKRTEAVVEVVPKIKDVKNLEVPVQKQIDAEVDALLAKVQEQQKTGVAYSDSEIDMLLRDAQRDIITEKLFKNTQHSVSADALLYEVEEELDPSFRDRIFEALKDGFLKAREAVVSRNN